MNGPVTAPDERAFREHLAEGAFLLGVANGQWRLEQLIWPIADISVTAAVRPNAPHEFLFRFDVTGYPAQAPTARLWDGAANGPLAVRCWPTGEVRFAKVFRADWKEGSCLYLPCDRISMQGHSDWPARYPTQWWTPKHQITNYLRIVSELLTSVVYKGVCS